MLILIILFLLNTIITPCLLGISNNFIHRMGFEQYCDHKFENSAYFDAKKIKPCDTIFVRSGSISKFFSHAHRAIKNPYILVSHIDDWPMPGGYIRFLNEKKLIAWFGINASVTKHEKFFPIPIGIIQWEGYNNRENLNKFFKQLQSNTNRPNLLHMNFNVKTNPTERMHVYYLFLKKPFCYKAQSKPFHEYMADMSTCKFVLSPFGFGKDCYRTWEALFAGCIPIVRSCALDPLYENLPVLVIKDWRVVTEEFLNKKYIEFSQKKYNFEKLYMEYWLGKIERVKVSKRKKY